MCICLCTYLFTYFLFISAGHNVLAGNCWYVPDSRSPRVLRRLLGRGLRRSLGLRLGLRLGRPGLGPAAASLAAMGSWDPCKGSINRGLKGTWIYIYIYVCMLYRNMCTYIYTHIYMYIYIFVGSILKDVHFLFEAGWESLKGVCRA